MVLCPVSWRPDWPLARFVIADASMHPLLQPGDAVIVWRWAKLRPGNVIVCSDPTGRVAYLAKRILDIAPAGLFLLGDNEEASRDSRNFGRVPPPAVEGRIIARYRPAARRAWLRDR